MNDFQGKQLFHFSTHPNGGQLIKEIMCSLGEHILSIKSRFHFGRAMLFCEAKNFFIPPAFMPRGI